MLVVSRRPDQTIVFPRVGITLRVLKVKGQVVKVGVSAPEDLEVLRGELLQEPPAAPRPEPDAGKKSQHDLRNRLNAVALCAELLRRQSETGRSDEIGPTLQKLLTELQTLDDMLAARDASSALPARREPAEFRVLVVEDQANERELLAGLLRMNGCTVSTAADGLEALERLRSGDMPDFVLLDMHMPRLGGPEVLHAIRSHEAWEQTWVFAVSGHTSDATGVPVGPNGVDGWFRKPLNSQRLLACMARMSASA